MNKISIKYIFTTSICNILPNRKCVIARYYPNNTHQICTQHNIFPPTSI